MWAGLLVAAWLLAAATFALGYIVGHGMAVLSRHGGDGPAEGRKEGNP